MGKSLYELLGVATTATPEVIEAAYQVQLAKLDKVRSQEAAAAMRVALNEAYRTLSNGEARAKYDRILKGLPGGGPNQVRATSGAATSIDDRSWFARNVAWIVVLSVVVLGSGYLYEKQRRAKVETERLLQQEQARLEAERAEREAAEAERQRLADEARAKVQERREYYQQQQVRAQTATVLARRDREQARAEATERSRIDRERRLEEQRQRREEYEARARLEQDKRKLRMLQCQNGPC